MARGRTPLVYPIPPRRRLPVFLAAGALAVVFGWAGAVPPAHRLATPAAPLGGASLQLAGTPARARAILAAWSPAQRAEAARNVRVDFAFIPAYSTALGLACAWAAGAARARRWRGVGLGERLAWGMWLAGACDAIENVGLLAMLGGRVAAPWPQLTAACAGTKWLLVFAGLAYPGLGLAARLFPKRGDLAGSD